MLITPDPVANDDAGSADVPSPIKVGRGSPTPMPDGITQRIANPRSRCGPASAAHTTTPPAKTTSPTTTTVAAPNLAINRLASNNDVTGTMKGPGAMARPIVMADQCHTPSSHSTRDSRKPPNAVENGAIANVARVKSRIRNRAGSMNGLSDRRQCATNNASIAADAAKLSMTAGAFQPQSCSFTIPNVSVAMLAVISAAAPRFGVATSWPGTGRSLIQPTTSASSPIGRLTRKIHRQLAVTSNPPTSGPKAAAKPPTAAQILTAPARRSAGKVARISPNDVGVSSAAPAACARRKATSISTLLARAQAADAAVKRATPTRKLAFRGKRSASLPQNTSNDAYTMA